MSESSWIRLAQVLRWALYDNHLPPDFPYARASTVSSAQHTAVVLFLLLNTPPWRHFISMPLKSLIVSSSNVAQGRQLYGGTSSLLRWTGPRRVSGVKTVLQPGEIFSRAAHHHSAHAMALRRHILALWAWGYNRQYEVFDAVVRTGLSDDSA
ncbi:hypothetical protein K503DRAFT_801000 [Rhizopogon vinicolor AM-OR11-026]|uniref:Uncharacterized protein n=1 Tax=Rhizopogon vinicolor AM-OR11-026 TaxID=1314800 RepID=A0A1B7MYU4_9AGAM|nr:hypothetical protein K503DRAFT_801000 [Rhizopogon vinicolor AM-OR11-026]